MDSPRDSHVTILLSTFDGEEWLPDLYASLLAQTHTDWTLRVRDDGSSDGTVAFLRACARDDPRVELLEDNRGNVGASASFMHLLATLDHGLFAFCDQDDVWMPHKLDASIESLGTGELSAVYTDAEVTDTSGAVTSPSALRDRGNAGPIPIGHLLMNNVAIGATMLGTAALAARAVELAGDRPVLMHDWWVALVAGYAGELTPLAVPTIRWRRHPRAVTESRPETLRDRAARKRRYAAWSIDAAQRLSVAAAGSAENRLAIESLAALDADRPTVRGLLRAWRVGGVRAWPLASEASLLWAVGMGRRDQ